MTDSNGELDLIVSEITLVLNKMLPEGWVHDRQSRPTHGFIMVFSGSICCEFSDGVGVTVPADEILYLPEGSSYRMTAVGGKLEYIIVNFRLSGDDGRLADILLRHIVPQDKLKISEKFRRLDELYFYMLCDYRTEMRACLYSILCRVLTASRMRNCPGEERRLQPALTYMRDNFASECSLDAISGKCGLSASHFRRLFRSYYRMTPKDYIISLRINSAKTLLTASELAVADIAERCGFNDPAYFCKIFRRETGMTPNAFRKSGGIDNNI